MKGMSDFYRCHKSYLVNMKHATGYVKAEGGYLLIRDKHHVPVSPDRVDELLGLTPFVRRK
jgi:two-component system LytT family response regulator